MKTIVYHSKAGHTERYAKALSKAAGVPAMPLEQAMKELPKDSHILFMSWVKAGTLEKCRPASKRFWIDGMCAVSLNITKGTERALRTQTGIKESFPFFMLPGGYDKTKLGWLDSKMMDFALWELNRNIPKKIRPSEQDLFMQEILTNGGDNYNEEALEPVIEWVKANKGK